MKNSHSKFILLLPLLITFTSATNSPETSIHHPLHDPHCITTTTTTQERPHHPRFQSQTAIPFRPPLPPYHTQPPPLDDEIDPRYGVSKRLVPSGPNPLHN